MRKPSKPYKDFPLFPHNNGQWAKKVKGQIQYFGTWDDPDAALARYVSFRDYGTRVRGTNEATIHELCEAFLNSKQSQADRGEVTKELVSDYRSVCKRFREHFGDATPIASITPLKLEAFRNKWPTTWAGKTVCNMITRLSAVLNYAHQYELIDKPIRYKAALARPSSKQLEMERAAKPSKFFEAEEIKLLVGEASLQMTAMIYLGVNAGFGGADCGRLLWSDIDLDEAWYRNSRGKTGQWREAWLWPETVKALRAIPRRHETLVFLTKQGRPWFVDGDTRNPIQQDFMKLCKRLEIHKKGRGHYALRHVFLTIADGIGDTVAMRIVLGQKDPSISHHYRERIDRERIRRVCDHVRQWYLGIPKKA